MQTLVEALVIVDMQPAAFTAATFENVVNNVIREVRKAKLRNRWIVVVEFDHEMIASERGKPEGTAYPTDERILRAIGNYAKTFTVVKMENGGGFNVVHECRQRGVFPKLSRVVGVNADCCVLYTAKELANYRLPDSDRLMDVRVVWDACGSKHVDRYDWKNLNWDRAKLVRYRKRRALVAA